MWVPTGQAPPAPPSATPPDPAVLAAQAAGELQLPAPPPEFSPAGVAYVNLPEWLWIDPAVWHPYSVTVTAANAIGSTSVTATATPVEVVWDMGDAPAPPTVCAGPGVAYDPDEAPSAQSTTCSHTYTESSAGQPTADGDSNDDAFPVTVNIQWQVQWSGAGASGTLPTTTTTTDTSLRVEQIEAVTCDGSCPATP